MINVLVPMAGKGSRFSDAGYKKPKPFIEVLGKTMIERVLENLFCENVRYILIAQEEHLYQEKDLVSRIKNDYPVEFVPINGITEGAACSALFARKYINNSNPLVIANSDQIIDINFQKFIDDSLERQLDGSIMTFTDPFSDEKWSFAALGEDLLVKEVAEKKAISDQATVGIYMFNKGSLFVDSAIDMMVRNERTNNEFYVCPVYNFCIEQGARIGIYNIDYDNMHGLGTPDDLNHYLDLKA